MTRAEPGSHRRRTWDGEHGSDAPGWDSARWREQQRAGAGARRADSGWSASGSEPEPRPGRSGHRAAAGPGAEGGYGGERLYPGGPDLPDDSGYESSDYRANGYDSTGYDSTGYDGNGYDSTGYDGNGYDGNGSGRGRNGSRYDANGHTGSLRSAVGYETGEYRADDYDRSGYDRADYDRPGYDRADYDRADYDRADYDRADYDRGGYDGGGYGAAGRDRSGYADPRREPPGYDPAYDRDAGPDPEPSYSRPLRTVGEPEAPPTTGSIPAAGRHMSVGSAGSRRQRAERDEAGPDDGGGKGKSSSPAASFLGAIGEVVIVVAMALTLALVIKTFLVQAFFIPSASMENTLLTGDRVLVSKLTPGPFDLHRGDIVVFKDPGGWLQPVPPPQDGPVKHIVREALTFVGLLPQDSGEHLIKRVIGLPGDTVTCCDAQGRLQVNGVSINEPYLFPGNVPSATTFSVKVPAGNLWVMGDHRSVSEDSRFHRGLYDGTVPMKDVVGKGFVIVWPLGRAGTLGVPSSVFSGVPGASGAS